MNYVLNLQPMCNVRTRLSVNKYSPSKQISSNPSYQTTGVLEHKDIVTSHYCVFMTSVVIYIHVRCVLDLLISE